MENRISFISLLLTLLLGGELFGREQVRVGGYDFHPYVDVETDKGVTFAVIEILNEIQSEYEFVFVETSANRRYKDLMDGNYDIIFFEDPKWGWKKYLNRLSLSGAVATDYEKFITQNSKNKSQDFFKNITAKNKIVILGYHYKFANFNSDPKVLKDQYLTEVTHSPNSVVESVAAGRKDLGLIANSYLASFFKKKPAYREKVMISDINDQEYELNFISKNSGKISREKVLKWVQLLKANKKFIKLLKDHSI